MARLPVQLFNPQLLPIDAVNLYTAPNGTTTVVQYLEVHNTSATPVTVTVYMTPSGELPGLANQLFSRAIAGKQSVKITSAINYTLPSGASVQAVADVADVVSIHGAGIEST